MPRENSFTDSEGRSLTPDLEEVAAASPAGNEQTAQHPHFVSNGHEHEHHFDMASLKSSLSKRSLRNRFLSHKLSLPVIPDEHPRERFRRVVHKVISMHRGTTLLNTRTIGSEPGIDPNRPATDATYRHIIEECEIEVIDYSAVRNTYRRLNNKEFVDLIQAEDQGRAPWAKVRWINIGGVSWDIIKALSKVYSLHPLSLEEIIAPHSQNRSKADYYPQHLFLNVACHELADDASTIAAREMTDSPRTSSPVPMANLNLPTQTKLDSNGIRTSNFGSGLGKLIAMGPNSLLPVSQADVKAPIEDPPKYSLFFEKESFFHRQQRQHKKEVAIVSALKRGSRVNVDISRMFFFLLRDGTVITIRANPDLRFTTPISYRLKSRDTVIRKSADASLLVFALIDLIVDKAIQVIDQYHMKIQKFELDILLSLKMNTVRDLHILSGDVTLHKRTLEPIRTLIYGLRRYDDDRAAALVDASDPLMKDVKVTGFMSSKSKIYLAGAYDHMEYVLTSLDMFGSIAENLIAYSFNTKSYEMNNVMRRLTITTIIFLPLSFLSGYFGMNFAHFWSVREHSDIFFWKIALPILVVVVVVALWMDLKELWAYLSKKREIKHIRH